MRNICYLICFTLKLFISYLVKLYRRKIKIKLKIVKKHHKKFRSKYLFFKMELLKKAIHFYLFNFTLEIFWTIKHGKRIKNQHVIFSYFNIFHLFTTSQNIGKYVYYVIKSFRNWFICRVQNKWIKSMWWEIAVSA